MNAKKMTIDEMINEKIPFDQIHESYYEAIKNHELWNPSVEDKKYYWEIFYLAIDRLKVLKKEKEDKIMIDLIVEKSNKMIGQLWEDCGFCGSEGPVYMSHGCCEKCAVSRGGAR